MVLAATCERSAAPPGGTLALVAYLLTSVGLPVPVVMSKQHDDAIRARGMPADARARECWDHCCCYSPREKLAWAQEQHVEPPAALAADVAAFEAEQAEHGLTAEHD